MVGGVLLQLGLCTNGPTSAGCSKSRPFQVAAVMFSRGANLDSMVIAEYCFLVDEFNQHHESGVA